jgi:hypothetical protein
MGLLGPILEEIPVATVIAPAGQQHSGGLSVKAITGGSTSQQSIWSEACSGKRYSMLQPESHKKL